MIHLVPHYSFSKCNNKMLCRSSKKSFFSSHADSESEVSFSVQHGLVTSFQLFELGLNRTPCKILKSEIITV
jgi:hypothetical protein